MTIVPSSSLSLGAAVVLLVCGEAPVHPGYLCPVILVRPEAGDEGVRVDGCLDPVLRTGYTFTATSLRNS